MFLKSPYLCSFSVQGIKFYGIIISYKCKMATLWFWPSIFLHIFCFLLNSMMTHVWCHQFLKHCKLRLWKLKEYRVLHHFQLEYSRLVQSEKQHIYCQTAPFDLGGELARKQQKYKKRKQKVVLLSKMSQTKTLEDKIQWSWNFFCPISLLSKETTVITPERFSNVHDLHLSRGCQVFILCLGSPRNFLFFCLGDGLSVSHSKHPFQHWQYLFLLMG